MIEMDFFLLKDFIDLQCLQKTIVVFFPFHRFLLLLFYKCTFESSHGLFYRFYIEQESFNKSKKEREEEKNNAKFMRSKHAAKKNNEIKKNQFLHYFYLMYGFNQV